MTLVTLQVQPDMEELTENAEDGADEGESKQSEVKLGKLQYKVSTRIKIW
jgi:synaptotagmin-1